MADFASLDNSSQSIPTSGASASSMQLTTPNSIITGTSAGMQALGAQNIKTDATRQRIVVNDGITNRVSFGRIGTGVNDWGMKVSKQNINIDTATNDQLIFNSSQDVLKVVSPPFNISVTATGGSQFVSNSVAHGLTFIPALLAYIQVPSSLSGNNPAINHNNPALIYGLVASVFRVFALAEVTVDATNVTIAAQTDGSVGVGTYTWTAKVYLLQETFS